MHSTSDAFLVSHHLWAESFTASVVTFCMFGLAAGSIFQSLPVLTM